MRLKYSLLRSQGISEVNIVHNYRKIYLELKRIACAIANSHCTNKPLRFAQKNRKIYSLQMAKRRAETSFFISMCWRCTWQIIYREAVALCARPVAYSQHDERGASRPRTASGAAGRRQPSPGAAFSVGPSSTTQLDLWVSIFDISRGWKSGEIWVLVKARNLYRVWSCWDDF